MPPGQQLMYQIIYAESIQWMLSSDVNILRDDVCSLLTLEIGWGQCEQWMPEYAEISYI